jgi:hypothetical protein
MKTVLSIPMALIVITFLALGFCGCSASKKAHSYFNEHPEEFAKDCADAYPVKDSIIVRDSTSYDTLYVDNEVVLRDTVTRTIEGKTQVFYREKKCPPHEVITKTVRKDSIIIRRDTAKETALKQDFDAEKLRSEKYKDKFNWWRISCLITWLLAAIYIAARIFSNRLPFKIK